MSQSGEAGGGVGAKIDLFSEEARGFESECVTDTMATTDKNVIFECGIQTWEKVGGQKWGKMQPPSLSKGQTDLNQSLVGSFLDLNPSPSNPPLTPSLNVQFKPHSFGSKGGSTKHLLV